MIKIVRRSLDVKCDNCHRNIKPLIQVGDRYYCGYCVARMWDRTDDWTIRQVKCLECHQVMLTKLVDTKECPWCCNIFKFYFDKIQWLYQMDRNNTTSVLSEGFKKSGCQIGVQTTTDVVMGKGEVRVGIALFGQTNMLYSIGANPFDRYFHDNYVSGKGSTLEESIKLLEQELIGIKEGLWGE